MDLRTCSRFGLFLVLLAAACVEEAPHTAVDGGSDTLADGGDAGDALADGGEGDDTLVDGGDASDAGDTLEDAGPTDDGGDAGDTPEEDAGPSEEEEEPTRRLVIIGGGLNGANHAVHDAILERREGDGPLCIIPTAGANPSASITAGITRFDGRGGAGTARGILLTEDNLADAFDASIVAELGSCSGYFFSGGQQSRIVRFFLQNGEPTPALEAIRARYLAGAVISGSSAGAAMMSHPMISGGSSAGAMTNGTASGGVNIRDGLGFFPDGILDQHFLARGRIGRLLVATIELDEVDRGFGIDEDTALVVDGDLATVIGASGVVIVDVSEATLDGAGSATGIRLDLVGDGDRYDLLERQVIVDPNKYVPAAPGGAVSIPSDVFARWAFLHLLVSLSGANSNVAVIPAGAHQLTVRRAPSFSVFRRYPEGVQGTPSGLTLGPLSVDVSR